MKDETKTQKTAAMVPAICVEEDVIPVIADSEHEYTVTTKMVAQGFGCSVGAIRSHKERNADELIEGKHFTIVANCNDGRGGKLHAKTMWTKRGVIRLGFFIKSNRAKLFRDAAEDLILRTIDTGAGSRSLPNGKWETILDYMESMGYHATSVEGERAVMDFGRTVQTFARQVRFSCRLITDHELGDFYTYSTALLDRCFSMWTAKRRSLPRNLVLFAGN